MRPTITWLVVLAIASMLVGTAYAECVAMNMPCCSQHHSTTCHEVCAAPTGNIAGATVPQFFDDLQVVATVSPVIPAPHFVTSEIRYEFAPPAENLLTRIHVLLL